MSGICWCQTCIPLKLYMRSKGRTKVKQNARTKMNCKCMMHKQIVDRQEMHLQKCISIFLPVPASFSSYVVDCPNIWLRKIAVYLVYVTKWRAHFIDIWTFTYLRKPSGTEALRCHPNAKFDSTSYILSSVHTWSKTATLTRVSTTH